MDEIEIDLLRAAKQHKAKRFERHPEQRQQHEAGKNLGRGKQTGECIDIDPFDENIAKQSHAKDDPCGSGPVSPNRLH